MKTGILILLTSLSLEPTTFRTDDSGKCNLKTIGRKRNYF